MITIEEQHKLNFEFIKKYNLKVGDKVLFEDKERTIKHIHSKYGWISNEYAMMSINDIKIKS